MTVTFRGAAYDPNSRSLLPRQERVAPDLISLRGQDIPGPQAIDPAILACPGRFTRVKRARPGNKP